MLGTQGKADSPTKTVCYKLESSTSKTESKNLFSYNTWYDYEDNYPIAQTLHIPAFHKTLLPESQKYLNGLNTHYYSLPVVRLILIVMCPPFHFYNFESTQRVSM